MSDTFLLGIMPILPLLTVIYISVLLFFKGKKSNVNNTIALGLSFFTFFGSFLLLIFFSVKNMVSESITTMKVAHWFSSGDFIVDIYFLPDIFALTFSSLAVFFSLLLLRELQQNYIENICFLPKLLLLNGWMSALLLFFISIDILFVMFFSILLLIMSYWFFQNYVFKKIGLLLFILMLHLLIYQLLRFEMVMTDNFPYLSVLTLLGLALGAYAYLMLLMQINLVTSLLYSALLQVAFVLIAYSWLDFFVVAFFLFSHIIWRFWQFLQLINDTKLKAVSIRILPLWLQKYGRLQHLITEGFFLSYCLNRFLLQPLRRVALLLSDGIEMRSKKEREIIRAKL